MVIENKTVFLLKRKTTLVVDNKCGCFLVDNSFFLVCDAVVDNYALQSMSVASGFFPCAHTDMHSEHYLPSSVIKILASSVWKCSIEH